MSVNEAQVRHVAKLARLALSDAEIDKMVPELNNILGWVEQLSEVDTDGVEPLTAVIDLKLRLRDENEPPLPTLMLPFTVRGPVRVALPPLPTVTVL